MWCIGGYNRASNTPIGPADDRYGYFFGGSSAAAPHVSGALALLKSAAPELPMAMIRQILLTTATDLGKEGIDEVFGWGAVNISAGIDHIENLEMANGMAYSDLRKSLPGEFSHLRGRLSEVSVALRITDRSYYNMRLSDIVGGGDSDSHSASLGNAAKEMQADDSLSPENSGFGFNYANGDYDLHYAGGGNENAFRFSGGLRHDDSQSSYIGRRKFAFFGGECKRHGRLCKMDNGGLCGIIRIRRIRADANKSGLRFKFIRIKNPKRTGGRMDGRISIPKLIFA